MRSREIISLLCISLILFLSACSLDEWTNQQENSEEKSSSEQKEAPAEEKQPQDKQDAKEEASYAYAQQLDEEVDKDGLTIIDNPNVKEVVVNKQRKLPVGYEPEELVIPDVPFPFEGDHPKKYLQPEAAEALEELFKGAENAGLELYAASGFRSYERQKSIYENNVKQRGQEEADKFSARPGTSEHQTGLAMDVTSPEMSFKLEQSFIETKEGKWLEDHAHEYGFVVRYLEGTKDITGYEYEPWHLRYVGKGLSTEIHESGGTLEEFFGFYEN
ncbi:D-alanyl-D-alanine carboxypeptidase family protein [Halobacillus sp. Marseille-Q1614]|uniref:M15 family metallopeptidase n=1 Tax=Halobacillus sp. Marseille-Q1614 TaxID=2709134 RepID=UPI0020C49B2B|nr:M15 family metallopeptidase [Halobacillus sp. Marseille-Q1614]